MQHVLIVLFEDGSLSCVEDGMTGDDDEHMTSD